MLSSSWLDIASVRCWVFSLTQAVRREKVFTGHWLTSVKLLNFATVFSRRTRSVGRTRKLSLACRRSCLEVGIFRVWVSQLATDANDRAMQITWNNIILVYNAEIEGCPIVPRERIQRHRYDNSLG